MSETRQQRLKRLVDMRAKELDRRVRDLSVARTRETKMEEQLVEARADKQRELAARDQRARGGLPAADWGHAEIWLTGLSHKEYAAQRQSEIAAREVVGARGRVAEAMMDREKIELLIGRLDADVRKEEDRAERKSEDESASVHAVHQRANNAKRGP